MRKAAVTAIPGANRVKYGFTTMSAKYMRRIFPLSFYSGSYTTHTQRGNTHENSVYWWNRQHQW